ncbi:pseudouridine synthase, partial [Meira miltonrushii]
RLPKKKCAIAFGYCGIGYSGLQINHGVKTIEGDIFEAFCKLAAVSKENAINPNKVGLQRAARTDRGVHAAGNLLTMKLILEPPGIGPNDLVKSMNEILPEFIRIWGFTRVQNSFNARTSCDSRQYEYLLPTYVFLPPKPRSHMYNTLQQWAEKSEGEEAGKADADDDEEYRPTIDYLLNHPFWKKQGSDKDFKSDTAAKKQWRISMKQLNRVREIFSKYEGSHNFHNFTVGKPFRDRSAHRHMIKLTISDPKIINETEWVSIKFHGQSFMLHQIRKMIGLLVLVGRTTAPASLIPETFGPARIHVPKAPGLGLLLEEPIFGGYNRRLEETMKRQNEDPISGNSGEGGIRKESVIFSARYGDQMEQFKQKWIYDRIHQEEEEKHEYVKFLQYLDVLSGSDFEYLNPKGVIPQSAILKVGEQQR